MANQRRKRKCRPAGEKVPVAKQAITTAALANAGKKNPADLPGGSGIRPEGKPEKIKVISLADLEESSHLPKKRLDLPRDTAARITKGIAPDFSGDASGEYLLTSEGMAIGIAVLEKGTLSSLARFSDPVEISEESATTGEVKKREKLTLDTPIEGLPVSDLLDAHWDIHMMFTLKAAKPNAEQVKEFTIEDLVNLHARIVDALMFRGTEHPTPPDNGLDWFSFEFERFAAKQPRHFQRPSSGGGIPLVKAIDPYQDVPPEDGVYRFVAQNHHADENSSTEFRIGFKPNEMLIGWEMETAPRTRVVVSSLSAAREFAADKEAGVIDWETGEWSTGDVIANRRPPHPWVWLDVQGATKKPGGGGPYDWQVAPGSGWTNPGVFLIVDRGEVEFGLQKSDVHEYFVKGERAMNYRIVFRNASWREVEEIWQAAEVSKSSLPPEDETLGAARDFTTGQWIASVQKDPRPMVLQNTAPMPADGFSALPAAIRKQVPAKFRYWKAKGDKARAKRDALVEALSSGAVKIDFSKTFKRKVAKRSLVSARFVSQKWVDFDGDGSGVHHLRVDVGRDEHLVIKSSAGIWEGATVGCEVYGDQRSEMMELEGELRQSHYLNKAKENSYKILKEDEGEATVMSLSDGFIRINFKGEKINGVFDVRKQGDEWIAINPRDADADSQSTPQNFVKIVKFAEDDGEERLVTGIVLEPDEIDTQNDTISAEGIKATAHDFLAKYNKESEMGLQHQSFGSIGVKLVESYIAPADMVIGGEKVKKGSWVITVKVISDAVWDAIKRGDFTGFSIGGLASIV